MKLKKALWASLVCLSLATVALAEGDTPIGNIIQQIIDLLTGG